MTTSAAQRTEALPRERALYLVRRRRLELATSDQQREDLRASLSASLSAFTAWAWPLVCPVPLRRGRDTDAIIEHAEAFYRYELFRFLLHVQPGSGKTLLFSVIPDAWRKTWDPAFRLVSCSNSDNRAAEHSVKTRELIQSPEYQALWPTDLKPGRGEKFEFETTTGGLRVALNFNGKLQGPGGDAQIADDPQTESDMWSPTTLTRHREIFDGGWMSRLRDKSVGPSALVAQRLGPWDLGNSLRMDEPNVWQVLALEGRKTVHSVGSYYRTAGSDVKVTEMPLIDTALSRDGRFRDDREPGQILSDRTPAAYLDTLEIKRQAVFQAQHQQSPILASAEGARVHAFSRARHLGSFAARMDAPSLADACVKALASGWRFTTGWDHGQEARREICIGLMWNERLREAWVVLCYANATRTTPDQDARAVRAMLDALGIPIRVVVDSTGDIGNMGKGAADANARPINSALSLAKYENGAPILGFPIGVARKGPGSVEKGTEVLNTAFGSDALHVDASCAMLAVALEGWAGGETFKDFVDALRYCAVYRLESWQVTRGVQS